MPGAESTTQAVQYVHDCRDLWVDHPEYEAWGGIENKHSPDVELTPPPFTLNVSRAPISFRVLALNDPGGRARCSGRRGAATR